MKSALAPVLLAAAAVLQALGRHVYHRDTIVVTGELFFPIFFAGLGIFYGIRAKNAAYATTKLALFILAVVVAVLTATGWGMALFWFYPSVWVYYAAFVLLVVNAVVAVLSIPSAKQLRAEQQGTDDHAPTPPENPSETQDDSGWRTARR